ncbi:hypothetical protein NQ314_014129 [Rhamnusium bicolor]|uniref:Uncharacterized protein n=1 Tax=Rhamnusium bicolor TaxID=1586634 RepID=A0AAV8X4G5_9CUCU|nr:hypothetical protein NQ314_014129 [Rhamnusium bicolor]
MRIAVSAKSRLEVTLRFLATGESFRSLMYATRIHETTISMIVPEVLTAIVNNLKQTYLKRQEGNRPKDEAMAIRDEYKNYFNSTAVAWQDAAVQNHYF